MSFEVGTGEDLTVVREMQRSCCEQGKIMWVILHTFPESRTFEALKYFLERLKH